MLEKTNKTTIPSIKYLFEPRSVAIIGCSTNPNKIGYKVLDNIVYSKYQGKIYPINPKGGEILGYKLYKTIEEVDGDIDLATICIPAKYVLNAVQELSTKNCKFLSIITSGFSEIGDIEEEENIVRFAHENGMRVLGPNIFGIYSIKSPINATFGAKDIEPGHVAIVTQSGALGVAMIGKTETEGIGLSAIVSVGNKSDIDEADLIEYLMNDEQTKVILLYIEGIKEGEKLIRVLREATKAKPIIIIKSGRSKRGALAAASHTGSLAGEDNVFSDIMNQVGALRALSVQEALDWAKFLSIQTGLPKGENVVIVTNGGGIGVLATDACEMHRVNLYDDQEVLKEIFGPVTPSFGSTKNPVDITGGASNEFYEQALQAAIDSDDIHSIICLGCETAIFDCNQLSAVVEKKFIGAKTTKPLVFSFFGGSEFERGLFSLKGLGVPIYPDVYQAVSCLGAVYSNYRALTYVEDFVDYDEPEVDIDIDTIQEVIDDVRKKDRMFLLVPEAMRVMEAAGIPMPKSYVAKNIKEAIQYAEHIGYPVVLKIVSEDIIHKSDAGGVALNLENREEVIDAYEAVMKSCRIYKPDAVIQGAEIVTMIKMDEAIETIIGARIDAIFGPTVMFGLGGIYVEVLKDVAFRAVPLTWREANEMVKQIRSYPLLLGVRGEAKKDIEGCIEVVMRLNQIIQSTPDISDIEINPCLIFERGKGVLCVDARILLTPPQKEEVI
ncbi:MAG: acetate--CoA ligase family protein [Candidatus Hodarchaeales archaeon]